MNNLVLRVNGNEYSGWKRVSVTQGIEAISGSFELSVSDRWNGHTNPWPIEEEDNCVVEVNGIPVIDGFIDSRELSYDARSHSLSVSGRDKTGALVDSSAVLSHWEFASLHLMALAKKLCDPFAIQVTLDPSIKSLPIPPDKFSIDPGEGAFEVLDRACRMSGVLPISDGAGGVLITRAGTARADTELVEGQNILRGSARYEATGRFGKYIVTGQKRGTDNDFGLDAASVRATAEDFEVKRTNRVLMVRPEGTLTVQLAKQRAAWEATVRKARGDTVSILVQDWVQASGVLWRPNETTKVTSPRLGVDGDMLITQVRRMLDEGGTFTELTLRDPSSFVPQPFIPANASVWKEVAHGV